MDAAIERIHNRPADQPLCMFLGLIYPHTPYRVEEPYFSAIDRAKLPKRVHADDCTGKPLMESEIRKYAGMQDFTDADWDELRAVYLGMCMKIDVQFGKLVEALKEEGIYDDCAIFFLSDHGDFTGDFDLPEKVQNCFEDCLTRVPLLIKPPKDIPLDPGISNSMVELVDFYATAMDLQVCSPPTPTLATACAPYWRTAAPRCGITFSARAAASRARPTAMNTTATARMARVPRPQRSTGPR